MATHSHILAWKMLWTEEPGGLQSIGLLGKALRKVADILTYTFTLYQLLLFKKSISQIKFD